MIENRITKNNLIITIIEMIEKILVVEKISIIKMVIRKTLDQNKLITEIDKTAVNLVVKEAISEVTEH